MFATTVGRDNVLINILDSSNFDCNLLPILFRRCFQSDSFSSSPWFTTKLVVGLKKRGQVKFLTLEKGVRGTTHKVHTRIINWEAKTMQTFCASSPN